MDSDRGIRSPNNTYDVLFNGESKSTGDLLEDFKPPVNPEKEIDDPEDSKPEDWVDTKMISDPEATKASSQIFTRTFGFNLISSCSPRTGTRTLHMRSLTKKPKSPKDGSTTNRRQFLTLVSTANISVRAK